MGIRQDRPRPLAEPATGAHANAIPRREAIEVRGLPLGAAVRAEPVAVEAVEQDDDGVGRHAATLLALQDPQLQQRLTEQGFEVVANTPEQFASFEQAEFARWKALIESRKITAD